ncbi:hypothetical protein GCM10020295_57920 [Streptomyces cinereospinus]
MRPQLRRLVTAALALTLLALAGVVPSWASPRDRPPSTAPSIISQAEARTAAEIPEPPEATTLAERRKQVKQERDELSPMHDYARSPGTKPTAKPHGRPNVQPNKGPAAETEAAPFSAAATVGPEWVSISNGVWPGSFFTGGHLQFAEGTGANYSGLWIFILDEAGKIVHDWEIDKATYDPAGKGIMDSGAWCYGWWPSNQYPADQCFWWANTALGGPLEDGKKYYAWIYTKGTDGTWDPYGTTSPLIEAFYTPDIPGAQAGICSCYAQAHRADPVNTATGMFYEQLTDASMVGPGVPLNLERTYRSDSTATGLFGAWLGHTLRRATGCCHRQGDVPGGRRSVVRVLTGQ